MTMNIYINIRTLFISFHVVDLNWETNIDWRGENGTLSYMVLVRKCVKTGMCGYATHLPEIIMLIHVYFRQVAADTHMETATEQSSAWLRRQRNRLHRDFRAPHKQINKAWWEMSPFADVGRHTFVGSTYYEYYISRRTPLRCRSSPCWLRRSIALNQMDHSAVSNKPVCIKYEYRKLIYCAFKINQRSAEIRV